ncbi:LysR family transcriptional regulator [Haloactinopolyspora sp.]|uniref:LysR family transcriptional regulator n=1 Tax=Haloactinopolyspora sp. TaxID=1966353 RepID=UPI002632D5F5|nr:LysR family transcriptional regulator [Haloactinopolyspora sp.]
MQPHQLEYFLAVAETGTFTAGAQRSRVVQSAVSTAIRQLERELGATLFVRGRTISLTPAGEALLPQAREVITALEAATAAVAATRGQVTGTVNLGMMFRFGDYDMAYRLAAFRHKHPDVVVRGRSSTRGSQGQIEALRRGDLDLAFVATTTDVVPGLVLDHVASERLRLACHASHPLAGSGTVSLDQIADETFIDSPIGWGNRSVVDAAFARAGLQRNVHLETSDFSLTQRLVQEGLGLAFLQESVLATDARVAVLDVEPALVWTARLARPASRPLSAAAAALATELLDGVAGVDH